MINLDDIGASTVIWQITNALRAALTTDESEAAE